MSCPWSRRRRCSGRKAPTSTNGKFTVVSGRNASPAVSKRTPAGGDNTTSTPTSSSAMPSDRCCYSIGHACCPSSSPRDVPRTRRTRPPMPAMRARAPLFSRLSSMRITSCRGRSKPRQTAPRPDSCDIWVGTQVPTFAQTAAAKVTGLPPERVRVHNHLLGGGFGRRLEVDFIVRAVEIAKQVPSPVKVVWTREEDIQHDMYRPYYYDRIAAGLDEHGKPIAWTHQITGSSIMARVTSELFPKTVKVMRAAGLHNVIAMVRGLDVDAVDGAAAPPYALPNIRVEYVRQEPSGIPTAFWRGVGPTHNIFVVESFIDELAAIAKQDPFEYRRALLDKSPRAKAVLELAAEQAGWGKPLPPRSGRGIALLHAFGETYIAEVAEVSVSNEGDVRVQRVVCAIDCGTIVNPDTVKAQMESGIIFGITAALFGEITIKDGRVQQGNFDDYRMLRINEAPLIDVHLVKSAEPPGGVGEPGTSAVIPAVANAIFAATGKRIRKLPIDSAQLKSA